MFRAVRLTQLARLGQLAFAGAALATLAACGGDSHPVAGGGTPAPAPTQPKVTVDELAGGAYAVSTGDADKPTVGRYYAGADGKRLLALEDAGEQVDLLLHRATASAGWRAVPSPSTDLDVKLLHSQARTLAVPDAPALAGRYVLRLADGKAADFQLTADGRITAGMLPGCRLSGVLGASSLSGALALSLDSSGCPGVPAHASGVLITDPQDAPASLRLLADDGAGVVDLRGYAEPGA